MTCRPTAVIIGAGPAGLTAAYELLTRSDIVPIVLEKSEQIGGISRTVNYKGNRIDIGGHRFFSKSDRVMQWWLDQMHHEGKPHDLRLVRSETEEAAAADGYAQSDARDDVMLVRNRKSRIYFLRRFFDYPISLSFDTIAKLGMVRMMKIGCSYAWAMLFAGKRPKNLEEFFISRFGRELYLTFFKSYTEKVWGESCANISAEWGAQRIKGLSITKAVLHCLKSALGRGGNDVRQKGTETSLIEQFLYPKYGPGQMWEIVAERIRKRGGRILMGQTAEKLHVDADRITAVEYRDASSGERDTILADYVFSTMPVGELVDALDTAVPQNVRQVSEGLVYRDFITVGLLMKKLKVQDNNSNGVADKNANGNQTISDNWIYIQEPDVLLGRLQIFNNWSPYMVADRSLVWLGLEYFCYESDDIWQLSDEDMVALAKKELARIDIIDADDVVDATVIRMPKTYPAYFGTYDRFDEIRVFTDRFANLFLVGRNGMHKYNNQDHSMLTAMAAVDNIRAGRSEKENIWQVNAEQEYHESRAA